MDDPTEESFQPEALETNNQHLILYTRAGSYIVIPNVVQFIKDRDAEALCVDENDIVHVLRKGLKKNQMQWVPLNEMYDE